MAIYAIGDVQGCFFELKALLAKIQFDPAEDTLWFTGDLVNRGPQSLEVLRYVKSLGEKHCVVLGNHDLHFLAIAYGVRGTSANDCFDELLNAPDLQELVDWLRFCPLLHHDEVQGYVLIHAGLAPFWTLAEAQQLAREVENVIRGNNPELFYKNMYGSKPDYWDQQMTGLERLASITNYLTRMRFCYRDGRLDLAPAKNRFNNNLSELIPWFAMPNRVNTHEQILFGHWATLDGKTNVPNVYALDTGCGGSNIGGGAIMNNRLTAMRLHDKKIFSVQYNCS